MSLLQSLESIRHTVARSAGLVWNPSYGTEAMGQDALDTLGWA